MRIKSAFFRSPLLPVSLSPQRPGILAMHPKNQPDQIKSPRPDLAGARAETVVILASALNRATCQHLQP